MPDYRTEFSPRLQVVACTAVSSRYGVLCRSLICASFFTAGAVGAALALRARLVHALSQRTISCSLFAVEVGLLVATWAIGMRNNEAIKANLDIDQATNVLLACIMGAAMGFHNVAAKEAIANVPATTVMTSTMITVAQNLSNTIEFGLAKHALLRLQQPAAGALTEEAQRALAAKYDDALGKFITTGKPLLTFTVGSIIGAITMQKGDWHCLAIPIAVVVFIMLGSLLHTSVVGEPAKATTKEVAVGAARPPSAAAPVGAKSEEAKEAPGV